MNSINSLHNLSDDELVLRCLHHDRIAWEEFFSRFSPLIKKTIRKTFVKAGFSYLCEDFDNIMDIHAVLVEKLYAKGILNKCPELSGLRSWLKRITANQTIEWLRGKGRLKNHPRQQEERWLKSLSTPATDDGEVTLGDLIADDADLFLQLEHETTRMYVEAMVEQIGAIDNSTHRWILRLHILGQMSLSVAELALLGEMSPLTADELTTRLDDLESSLASKETERLDDFGRAILCWHQLRDLEVAMARLDRDTFSDHTQEIEALRGKWEEQDCKRTELLRAISTLPRPSNKEIADIVGIPEEHCGNVSQYLRRARGTLRTKLYERSGLS